jgi:hypothetical protein
MESGSEEMGGWARIGESKLISGEGLSQVPAGEMGMRGRMAEIKG